MLKATRDIIIIQIILRIFLPLIFISIYDSKKNKRKKLNQTVLFSLLLGFFTMAVTGFLVFSNWKINQKRAELNVQDRIAEKGNSNFGAKKLPTKSRN